MSEHSVKTTGRVQKLLDFFSRDQEASELLRDSEVCVRAGHIEVRARRSGPEIVKPKAKAG